MKTLTVNLPEAATEKFGTTQLNRTQIDDLMQYIGSSRRPGWIWKNKISRGVYDLSDPNNAAKGNLNVKVKVNDSQESVVQKNDDSTTYDAVIQMKSSTIDSNKTAYVPKKNPIFVPCSNFKIYKSIIKSGQFYPVYVTAESGVGKTLSIIQACCATKRECIRVNFTEETSERDLIGGMKLKVENGASSTKWNDGPVLTAMKRGAILLLDEVDLGTSKTMCLQSIMEGNPYINKQNGEIVYAADGFNVFATANTKGQLAGRANKFIGARPQNEAFLDRFAITINHEGTPIDRILMAHAIGHFGKKSDIPEEAEYVIEDLAIWAGQAHESYRASETDNFITPRRVCDILKGYFILGDVDQSLKFGVQRFTEDEQDAYLNLWQLVKKDREKKLAGNEVELESDETEDPFDIDQELTEEQFQEAIDSVLTNDTTISS